MTLSGTMHQARQYMPRQQASVATEADPLFEAGRFYLEAHHHLCTAVGAKPTSVLIWLTIYVAEREYRKRGESDGHMPRLSARAIARATGLPRETVRRSVAAMLAEGLIVERPSGIQTQWSSALSTAAPALARAISQLAGETQSRPILT